MLPFWHAGLSDRTTATLSLWNIPISLGNYINLYLVYTIYYHSNRLKACYITAWGIVPGCWAPLLHTRLKGRNSSLIF